MGIHGGTTSGSTRSSGGGHLPTLGILGGGQLGRLMLQAAVDLDLTVHVLDPDPRAPCLGSTPHFHVGRLTDADAVLRFGRQVDVLTVEIEEVHTGALRQLAAEGVTVHPSPDVLDILRDKRRQKAFYLHHGLPTAPLVPFEDAASLHAVPPALPCVVKAATGGYDGRGVWILQRPEDLAALPALGPGLVEAFVADAQEIAIIVARDTRGRVELAPPVAMAVHPGANLLDTLHLPAALPDAVLARAAEVAAAAAEALGVVGLLAVELFVTPAGEVLINEAAPRPHNSGHPTIECCLTSQYTQALRAVLGLPLAPFTLRSPGALVNLLGAPGSRGRPRYLGLEAALATPGAFVHLYGKAEVRPMRKMGHITVIAATPTEAEARARDLGRRLQVVGEEER